MNAAIYARKSTDQSDVTDEAKSVTRQIEHAKAYAAAKGFAVAEEHIYVDDAVSGAEFEKRPGLARLMNALRPRPPFRVLVVSEESRIGREQIETAYVLKQIIIAGVRVFDYLKDRELVLDSPTDKVMLSLTTFADELEREKARQRTTDALLRKAKAGHVTAAWCSATRTGRSSVTTGGGPTSSASFTRRKPPWSGGSSRCALPVSASDASRSPSTTKASPRRFRAGVAVRDRGRRPASVRSSIATSIAGSSSGGGRGNATGGG